MVAWRIQLLRGGDDLKEMVVPGLTLQSALDAAGYDLQQVVSAQRCLDYSRFGGQLSQHKQMIFLMKLLPYYISGAPDQSAKIFKAYAPVQKLLNAYPAALDVNLSLSERLEALHFNPLVITILRAGEQSGEVAEVLRQAIANLQTDMEMNKKARKGVVGGLLLFVVSIAILFGVAAGTAGALDSIVEAGLIAERNFAGALLQGLGNYASNHLWSLFVCTALIAGLVAKFNERARAFWPFSIFTRYLNVLRSIRLVSVWLILERAGLSIEHDERLLATAIGKKPALRISQQRSKGETFSELLDSRYFSPTLEECCQSISALSTTNKISLLEQIVQLLDSERAQLAAQIARTFYMLGVMIAFAAIALILGGVLLPIYSAGLGDLQI